jgi:hypothetical protein
MDISNFVTATWNVFMILFPILLLIGIFVTWMAWIGGCWRFKRNTTDTNKRETTIRYMIVKFLIEIINDFKHVLAILLTLMFVITVFSIIYFALFKQENFATFKDGLQVVVASLGGLVGSIIGYYFGESAASKRSAGQNSMDTSGREIIQEGSGDTVVEASRPPNLNDAQPSDDMNAQNKEGE